MRSALGSLLQSEIAENVIAFLRGRGERAHIIAPEWVQRRVQLRVSAAPTRPTASWSQNLPDAKAMAEHKRNFIVVAEDAAEERALIASLGNRKASEVYGLFCHVLSALLCGVNGMAAGHSVRGIKRYALLCVPRSGSRYLAAVLSNRGVGAAKEHIREPLAGVITEAGLGYATAVSALERFGQRNRIFGTKVISTFLLKASNRRMREAEANIAWMIERGYAFFRLDRPLEDAVVSSYIAFLMKKWHFFGEFDEASKKRLDSLAFEGTAAWEEFIRFRAEKVVVDSLAKAHAIPTVRYSEIETDIDGVVDRVCGQIGVDQTMLQRGSARIPLSTRTESPTYAIFAERLNEVLHKKSGELEPRTIAKLRALTGVGKLRAEKLIAEAISGEPSSG